MKLRKMSENKITLSILILSLVERIDQLRKLLSSFDAQIADHNHRSDDSVEIIVDLDNGKRSISSKRNNLLHLAKGEFLCFIDDDDSVSEDFVESIATAIKTNPNVDCITYDQSCIVDDRQFTVSFGLGHPITSEDYMRTKGEELLRRPPYHMCAFKSKIAKKILFSNSKDDRGKSVEDIDWLLRIYPYLNIEYKIQKILHHYKYCSDKSRS